MRVEIQVRGEASVPGAERPFPFTLTLSESVEGEPPPALRALFDYALGKGLGAIMKELRPAVVADPWVVARHEAGNVTFSVPLSGWTPGGTGEQTVPNAIVPCRICGADIGPLGEVCDRCGRKVCVDHLGSYDKASGTALCVECLAEEGGDHEDEA